MEQIILDVKAYADAAGITPQRVLRLAIGASWRQWDEWVDGSASCTVKTLDRLRKYMRENPPKNDSDEAA